METKFHTFEKGLKIWAIIVFVSISLLQLYTTFDGRWNHVQSAKSLEVPTHTWIIYAFLAPVDTSVLLDFASDREDANQYATGIDWLSRIVFFVLIIGYGLLWLKYKHASIEKNKLVYMSILWLLNLWLFIDTIYLFYLKIPII
jgi:hypothetical protein